MSHGNNIAALQNYSLGALAQYAGISQDKANQLGFPGLTRNYNFNGLTGPVAPPPPPAGSGTQLDIPHA